MEWQHIRYVPVEDNEGHLVGLVSYRALLRMLSRGTRHEGGPVAVRDVMKSHPVTAAPETPTVDAIETMRTKKVGCLPIVRDGRLLGIVTEHDLAEASARLFDRWLREA
jgi:CBS domain-containing protein